MLQGFQTLHCRSTSLSPLTKIIRQCFTLKCAHCQRKVFEHLLFFSLITINLGDKEEMKKKAPQNGVK